MKLYATITSERGKETGKGGNDWLEVRFCAENLKGIPTRANIYSLLLKNIDGELLAELLDYSTGDTKILTDQGVKPCGCEKNVYACREHAKNKICRHCGKIHKNDTAICEIFPRSRQLKDWPRGI